MLQIVASLIDTARGVIYDHRMFIVQATGVGEDTSLGNGDSSKKPVQLLIIEENDPGVDLIKLLGVNLLTLLCKLDHFINICNIYGIFMKRSSLQNNFCKFTPKNLLRSTPGLLVATGSTAP
jgi:hypothetical protein